MSKALFSRPTQCTHLAIFSTTIILKEHETCLCEHVSFPSLQFRFKDVLAALNFCCCGISRIGMLKGYKNQSKTIISGIKLTQKIFFQMTNSKIAFAQMLDPKSNLNIHILDIPEYTPGWLNIPLNSGTGQPCKGRVLIQGNKVSQIITFLH